MQLLDEVMMYKDLGIGAVSMIIFYSFARYTSERALTQVEEANRRGSESQQRFMTFIETAYKDNTKTIQELISEFREHIKTKERALDMLEENQKNLEEKYDILRRYHEP